jgi:DNA processing protein
MPSGVGETRLDGRAYWVLLTLVPQIGPSRFQRLLDVFGEPEAVWNAKPLALAEAGLDRRAIEGLTQLRQKADPAETWSRLEQRGISVVTLSDRTYPEHLREIADPPPVLYLKGSLLPADRWAVAVVGTRRVTAYGR